jgi:hypothetical protein
VRTTRPLPLVAISTIAALLFGGAISLLAFYVARYGPSGGDWSFKGNGALAVYPAIAAVIAGGWTALALHARRSPRWLAAGFGAGLVGLALALVAAAVLPVLGVGADMFLTPALLIALVLWMPIAPVWAALRPRGAAPIDAYGPHVVAAGAWLVAAAVGLIVVGIVIPAGS